MPAERTETLLSAIFFVTTLIASSLGVDPELIHRRANDVYSTRPKEYKEPTAEELKAKQDEKIREGFAPMLAKIKAAMERGENHITI
jgi:hypothetical protein